MTIDEAIAKEKRLSEECLKCSLDKHLECGEAREIAKLIDTTFKAKNKL